MKSTSPRNSGKYFPSASPFRSSLALLADDHFSKGFDPEEGFEGSSASRRAGWRNLAAARDSVTEIPLDLPEEDVTCARRGRAQPRLMIIDPFEYNRMRAETTQRLLDHGHWCLARFLLFLSITEEMQMLNGTAARCGRGRIVSPPRLEQHNGLKDEASVFLNCVIILLSRPVLSAP
jgi:hypothetical protein